MVAPLRLHVSLSLAEKSECLGDLRSDFVIWVDAGTVILEGMVHLTFAKLFQQA